MSTRAPVLSVKATVGYVCGHTEPAYVNGTEKQARSKLARMAAQTLQRVPEPGT